MSDYLTIILQVRKIRPGEHYDEIKIHNLIPFEQDTWVCEVTHEGEKYIGCGRSAGEATKNCLENIKAIASSLYAAMSK